jgi:hypothetical protein
LPGILENLLLGSLAARFSTPSAGAGTDGRMPSAFMKKFAGWQSDQTPNS